tara:strand:- start:647 stop:994 length:348 start_codon:yes stop_codon:yes gene_type:complete
MKKLILTIIIALYSSIVFAGHDDDKDYDYFGRQVPVMCGLPNDINDYIIDHGFKIHSLSVGRRSANPDGDPVYMVTRYVNDKNEELVTINVPGVQETCMLYHGHDLHVVEKGLTN